MSPAERIIDYVMDHCAAEPIGRRARLCRDLAALIVDDHRAEDLLQMAADLESIEIRHQQLLLDFRAARNGRAE